MSDVPSVFIAETRTGIIWDEIEPISGEIYDDLFAQNITGRIRLPRIKRYRKYVSQEGRNSLVVGTPDRVWWAGPIWDHATEAGDPYVNLSAASIWTLLARRPCWLANANPGPPNAGADLHYENISLRGIAVALVQNAMNWDQLPIVLPTGPFPGNNLRHYESYELANTEVRLRQISEIRGDSSGYEDDGPEIHFQPEWVGTNNARFQWRMRLGTPTLRQAGDPHYFDTASDDVAGLGEAGTAEGLSSHAWLAGDGEEYARLIGYATSNRLTNAGWPLLAEMDTSSHSSVVNQDTINAHARATLTDKALIQLRPQLRLTDNTTPFGEWQVGDRAVIIVSEDDWIDDGVYPTRLTGWQYTLGSDTITVAADDFLEDVTD